MQCGIGLNASGDFTAIRFQHCDIEEDKVRLKVPGCLMSYTRIVIHGFLSGSVACGKKFDSIVLFMIFSNGLSHRLPNLFVD
jgi:hypothetical protein